MMGRIRGWLMVVFVGVLGGCSAPDQPAFQGSSVPWAELLTAAEQKAMERDSEAQFVRLVVLSDDWDDTLDATGLRLHFLYIRPNGEKFFVVMDDTDPSTALITAVDSRTADSTLRWTPERALMNANLGRVVLSPSQVIGLTWEEGYPLGSTGRLDDNPSLTLQLSPVDSVSSQNPLWSIYYEGPKEGLRLWVDAVTGEIVHRKPSYAHD